MASDSNKIQNGHLDPDLKLDELNKDEEKEEDCWMMNDLGSMNLLDDSNHFVKKVEVSTSPVDKGWAWMTVLGCFGMHILTVAGIKSFGVLFVELEHRYDTTASTLASIQAVAATFMMGMCPISNALSVRFGCRPVVFLGGILMGLGFVLSAFVPTFQWLFGTYGVITGLGFGLSYAPCIVFVGHHFSKYRALANGLSVSGSGVGTFFLPPLIQYFIEQFSLSGALLLIGAIMSHVCVCASLFRPIASYPKKTVKIKTMKNSELCDQEVKFNEEVTETLLTEKHNHFKNNGEKSGIASDIQPSLLAPNTQMSTFHHSQIDIAAASLQDLPVPQKITEKDIECCCFKSFKTSNLKSNRFCNFTLMTNPVFLIFLAATTIANFGYPNVFIMIPSYAEEIGLDKETGALLVSVIGVSDLFGRIFFGWFSDRRLMPRKYEYMGTMLISGVLSLILPFVKSRTMLFVYCSFYGCFAGAYICLIAVVLVDTLGLENLSTSFGLVGLFMTVGLFTGPPIIGGLRDASGSWDNSFILVGAMAIAGSLIILLEPAAQKRLAKQRKN